MVIECRYSNYGIRSQTTSLKTYQKQAFRAFLDGKDVFISLPARFGKLLCFQSLSFVYDSLDSGPQSSIIEDRKVPLQRRCADLLLRQLHDVNDSAISLVPHHFVPQKSMVLIPQCHQALFPLQIKVRMEIGTRYEATSERCPLFGVSSLERCPLFRVSTLERCPLFSILY